MIYEISQFVSSGKSGKKNQLSCKAIPQLQSHGRGYKQDEGEAILLDVQTQQRMQLLWAS